jgi:hypothetical protein
VNKIAAILGVVAVVSAGTVAHAHGKDGVHLRGVVKAVGDTSLTLVVTDQKEVTVKTSEKTEVMRGDKRSALSEVRSGERAVVHAAKTNAGDLEAQLIKLGTKKAMPTNGGNTAPKPSAPKGEDHHGEHKH